MARGIVQRDTTETRSVHFYRSCASQLIVSRPKYTTVVRVSVLLLVFGFFSVDGRVLETVGPCKVRVDGRLINLEDLQSTDGTPRFEVEWRGWNYSFNPCTSFNLPTNPHHGLGDQCPFVSVCKSKLEKENGDGRYYTMGIQSTAKFHTKYKMYQRYRKQIEAQLNDDEDGGKEEVEKEEEESEESEEDSSSSSSSEEEEEEEEELYDYQYLLEDYKEMQDDLSNLTSTAPNNTAIDITDLSGNNVSNSASETKIIDLTKEKRHKEPEDNDTLHEVSLMEENTTQNDSFLTGETPVAKENTVAKEFQNGRRISPEITKEPIEVEIKATTEALFSNEYYDSYGEDHEDADAKFNDNYNENPDERIAGTMPMFKAHERRLVPYLSYQDFLPILTDNSVMLTYRGVKTMRKRWTHIELVCDYRRKSADEATFNLVAARGLNLYFELSHRCCCPDACLPSHYAAFIPSLPDSNTTDSNNNGTGRAGDVGSSTIEAFLGTSGPRFLWLVLVVNGSLLACAILIGGTCCRKGGGGSSEGQYTSMLPVIPKRESPPLWRKGIHSSQMTINSVDSHYFSSRFNMSPEYLDYSSSATRKQQQSVAEGGIVDGHHLEIGQRLGGGLFSDTYMAELKERRVAAKRITVGVHKSQLTDADYEWIVQQVLYLSKQRHKYLVSMLGICVDTRQPYIITEFIPADSLKDLLLREDEYLTWPRRVKMCIQVADALAFLHSAKYPILHRDLRCGNVLVEPSKDRIKVVDYGLVKIIQRLRQQCSGRRDCYCQKELSALPASVRWSAPEVLCQPRTDEYHSDILCPATDMYSFGMMLWEVAALHDPFEHIADETEVMEIVKSGGRPSLEDVTGVLPHYIELIKVCWVQEPDDRPSFKQVVQQLKNIAHIMSKMSSGRRIRQPSETTSFLRSALNMAGLN